MTPRRLSACGVLLAAPLLAALGCSTASKLPEAEARALSARRALVVSGVDFAELEVSDAQIAYHFQLERGGEVGAGTAFAVTADGYLLTAAHTLDPPGGVVCVYLDKSDGVAARFVPADVVFIARRDDIAVLKVAAVVPEPFLIAATLPAKGSPVVSSGFRRGSQNGTVVGFTQQADRRTRIEFERKGKVGDSGGPLLDAEGRAIGVMVEWVVAWRGGALRRFSVATAVDQAWWDSVAGAFARDPRFRPAADSAAACRLRSPGNDASAR